MWNSYWSGRPRRNIPQVNYNQSSDEDDFNSPLVSPSRPPPTRSGSPVELAVPTLCDNVDDELEAVSQTLRNVSHTHTFRGTKPRPDPEGGAEDSEEPDSIPAGHTGEEEVVVGHISGGGNDLKVESNNAGIMPPQIVNFDDENAQDGDKAIEHTRSLLIEYNANDVRFWFTQLENEMITCDVKSQWLKRVVLVKNLPSKIQEDVKSLLILQKSEAPDDLYKQIKTEILRIHAPTEENSYKKALSRVLVGLPSQLGQTLINDICKKSPKLTNCCCSNAVYTLWTLQLPLSVRSHVASLDFNAATYKAVFQSADKVFLSTKDTQMAPSVAAIISTDQKSGEVAAVSSRGGNRGGNRGYRGGRGNRGGGGSGRGGNNSNSTSSTATSSSTSSRGQGRGPRHASNPPNQCCDNHYRFGDQSWNCQSPYTCPWKDKIAKREKPENK